MASIRTLTQRYPIPFVVLLCILMTPLTYGVSALLNLIPISYGQAVFSECVHMLWPVSIALLLGYGFVFRGRAFGKTLFAGLPVFVFYVFTALITILSALENPEVTLQSPKNMLLGLLMMFGIGVREEVFYRGIVVNAVGRKYAGSRKGIWFTVLLSGALFGVVHMYNLFTGVTFLSAVVQSTGAMAIGIAFTAIYLRGGNLWFLVLTHAIVDFSGLFESTFVKNNISDAEQINSISTTAPLFLLPVSLLFTAFLLRKKKLPDIIERMNALRN